MWPTPRRHEHTIAELPEVWLNIHIVEKIQCWSVQYVIFELNGTKKKKHFTPVQKQ